MCGATSSQNIEVGISKGLSPRVWGNLRGLEHRWRTAGSIPTCVGQPDSCSNDQKIHQVYPHVCGATYRLPCVPTVRKGLSPRVWGNLSGFANTVKNSRSIPTCVGQPSTHTCATSTSSGSIPTCVGQPRVGAASSAAAKVYPHVCGATVAGPILAGTGMGLSPRVWGNQYEFHPAQSRPRSIPTCVGQPLFYPFQMSRIKVYPHVCGATFSAPFRTVGCYGLSPRVWGNHARPHTGRVAGRSIPTCVGQPGGCNGRNF